MPDDEKPIVRLSTPNTPNDLAIFAEQWEEVVKSGVTAESVCYSFGNLELGVCRAADVQPMDCGCVPEWPVVTPLMREVARLIDELHHIEGCDVGGPLHIVTDDPNYEDHSLNFCAQAVFDEIGPNCKGWWREDQTPDETQRMIGIGLAILWGLSSMTYDERAVAAGFWPLPDDGSRDPRSDFCHGPEQENFLYCVERDYDFDDDDAFDDDGVPIQPAWCCDAHWAETLAMRARRLEPKPCVPVDCPPTQEVWVTPHVPPLANPFGLWLPGDR